MFFDKTRAILRKADRLGVVFQSEYDPAFRDYFIMADYMGYRGQARLGAVKSLEICQLLCLFNLKVSAPDNWRGAKISRDLEKIGIGYRLEKLWVRWV